MRKMAATVGFASNTQEWTDNLKNINLLDGRNALYVRHRMHQIDPQSWTRAACLHGGTYISKRGLEQSTNITTFSKVVTFS